MHRRPPPNTRCPANLMTDMVAGQSAHSWTIYINTDIKMKPVEFLGDSLDQIRAFPEGARHDAGFQLERVQRGLDPDDWKPIKSIGPGVREIRVRDAAGAFR